MPIDASGSMREPGAVTIRPAIKADLSTIVDICAHHVHTSTASFGIDAPDLAGMTRRFHALQKADISYVMTEAGGAPLGYAYASSHHARPTYRHTVEDSIYLDTAAQGRDVGTLLLEALIREYQAYDFKQMVVVVGGGYGDPGSAKLYAHRGFHEVSVLRAVGYKSGRQLGCLLVQRAL